MYTDKVVSDIKRLHPYISIELVKVATKGDQFYFEPPPEWGGKSLYGSDVDQTLLDRRADIAVHVIEERPRASTNWPRGWLSALSYPYGNDSFCFITDLRKIPELLFSISKSRSD
ncbi:porphobilinogen deaminase [Mariprofundus micogutta]|uniref:Porphobilinogen deaminase n=2 Tax=Mariprofundus micogutta TaxID=1921010 RepID=A0A1L8CNZ8_9PROT|nr:porphobilinogen deaminase [Mariprofundus micogutta]